jgi:hypothetical protein
MEYTNFRASYLQILEDKKDDDMYDSEATEEWDDYMPEDGGL